MTHSKVWAEKLKEAVKDAADIIAPLQSKIPYDIGTITAKHEIDVVQIVKDANDLVEQGHIGPIFVIRNLCEGVITAEQAQNLLGDYNQEQ